MEFTGKKITIPASCVSDRSQIKVMIKGSNGESTIDDWTISEVDRPKKSKDSDEFIAIYKSKTGADYKYQDGDEITIRVIPVDASPEKYIDFPFKAKSTKKALVLKGVEFERVQ